MSDDNTDIYTESTDMYAAPAQKTSTLAIISLIAGIVGWTVLPLIGSLVAVITGHMAKAEIKEHAGSLGGDGLATAGLVLGYLSLALGLCICLIILAAVLFFIPIAASQSSIVPALSSLFI
jgi:hypothetical protein